MSDESKLGEIESQDPLAAYQDHAAELQNIVQGVARLRRWSRFSVLWIVTACLCVFSAILFAEIQGESESYRASPSSHPDSFQPPPADSVWAEAPPDAALLPAGVACDEEVARLVELLRENERAEKERLAAVSKISELTARALRAEKEAAELRRENDELKRAVVRAAVRESRENVRLGTGDGSAIPNRTLPWGERINGPPNAPSGRISVADKPTGDASSLSPDAVLSKIQSAYMAGLIRCYGEYLKKDASARGKVSLSLTVNETGRTVKGAAHGFASEVDECITGLMTTWRFPIPKDKDGEATEANFEIALQLVPD